MEVQNYVAQKAVPIKLSAEECVIDMGQRSNYVALKGAQIKLRKGECAVGMGQLQKAKYASNRLLAVHTILISYLDH